MRSVICGMGVSLDGYIAGPDGGFGWSAPDDELFRDVLEEFRGVGAHLLGRRLYETMLFWETADTDPALSEAEREWAVLWKALPRTVLSRTLTSVQGDARLATGSLVEEVARWRDEPGEGDLALGGASLVRQAAEAGLVDEYRVRVHPVLVGGGTPLFAHAGQQTDLELVETRSYRTGVLRLRYRVRR